jgi:hypothetical protein
VAVSSTGSLKWGGEFCGVVGLREVVLDGRYNAMKGWKKKCCRELKEEEHGVAAGHVQQ